MKKDNQFNKCGCNYTDECKRYKIVAVEQAVESSELQIAIERIKRQIECLESEAEELRNKARDLDDEAQSLRDKAEKISDKQDKLYIQYKELTTRSYRLLEESNKNLKRYICCKEC